MASENFSQSEHTAMSDGKFHAEAFPVLQKLRENGAVLAVAAGMEKAVIVCDAMDLASVSMNNITRELAEAIALKGWIESNCTGRISRYRITATGRAAFNLLLAERENSAMGFAEAQMPFSGASNEALIEADIQDKSGRKRIRYGAADTPLAMLARRRDRDGERFLSDDLVRAGERLREDFELAQALFPEPENWKQLLNEPLEENCKKQGSTLAHDRALWALRDLGPGLGDVALRCCCFLEGLEKAEKRMGWSARSGKIALRIALQRLHRHYVSLGEAGGIIG